MSISIGLLSAILTTSAVIQEAPKNMTFETKLKSVAVFRDGFGYYVREGKVKLENGWATTNLVPTAVKGTVWFYSLDTGDKIDTIVMGKENKIQFASPAEIRTKLKDKIGLKLTVITKSNQRFEGELSKILDDMLLLKVGDAFNAVPYDQVQTIEFVGFPVRIKVDTKNPAKVANIGVAYLQEGIRWEPSYVLDLRHGTANLNLRATMQNTAEKLDKTDVFFVVGAPFVANRGIEDMMAHIPGAEPGMAAKLELPKKLDRETPVTDPDAVAPTTSAALSRDESGELFYYKKPELSLDTTDVAMVSIFDVSIPVSPRFEWNADGEEVSYLLSLQNKSGQPLTTGPVFVLEEGRALGQENVRYTPNGGTAEIRLSQGIGLKVEKREAEVRRATPVTLGKTVFVPVTLEGTLTVTNFRTSKATITVSKTMRGKVGKLSDLGTVKQTQILNGEPNPINDVEWKLDIAPGTTKKITYTYETYMSAEKAGAPPVPAGPGDDRG
ncbi:MAG: hypothetical protein P4L46_21915 [Fimbriimonas sp.]|nr:hypothetical protein [Fimbriimonas sp.]